MEIEISYEKSLEENASTYFDKAKKLKKKLEGAREAVVEWENKLEKLQKEKGKQDKVKEQAKVKTPKKWFHKFRWFYTSSGHLVVGGRDATTNEIVVKKHTEPNDLVFHTDMAGSPFFVLKTENKDIDEATLEEVGDATCTFSRAWKLNLGAQEVFYVKPEQLEKGSLPKGAFLVTGKTPYVKNQVNLSIGMSKDGIMAGPEEAISKHCEKFVILVQGNEKASTTAKLIQKHIGGDLDEIIRVMPSGSFRILEER